MTRFDLIERLSARYPMLARDADMAVRIMLDSMFEALSRGDRVEIRGFGSFDTHYRLPRVGRNPKSGDTVSVTGKFVPRFRAGRKLKERLNDLAT
jgi:integration host factor subunit beta